MAKNQNTVVTATQKTEPNAKKDALATALAQIEKQFGKGAVMRLGQHSPRTYHRGLWPGVQR